MINPPSFGAQSDNTTVTASGTVTVHGHQTHRSHDHCVWLLQRKIMEVCIKGKNGHSWQL